MTLHLARTAGVVRNVSFQFSCLSLLDLMERLVQYQAAAVVGVQALAVLVPCRSSSLWY